MSKFREFVRENEKWFKGRLPETDSSLDKVESELGLKLPSDIRWLLKEYGYWHGTGVSNIEESVDDTKQAREHLHLPSEFIVLNDHQDGGVILLDTYSCRVIDTAWESVPSDLDEEIIYPDLTSYCTKVIETEAAFLSEEDIECTD